MFNFIRHILVIISVFFTQANAPIVTPAPIVQTASVSQDTLTVHVQQTVQKPARATPTPEETLVIAPESGITGEVAPEVTQEPTDTLTPTPEAIPTPDEQMIITVEIPTPTPTPYVAPSIQVIPNLAYDKVDIQGTWSDTITTAITCESAEGLVVAERITTDRLNSTSVSSPKVGEDYTCRLTTNLQFTQNINNGVIRGRDKFPLGDILQTVNF